MHKYISGICEYINQQLTQYPLPYRFALFEKCRNSFFGILTRFVDSSSLQRFNTLAQHITKWQYSLTLFFQNREIEIKKAKALLSQMEEKRDDTQKK